MLMPCRFQVIPNLNQNVGPAPNVETTILAEPEPEEPFDFWPVVRLFVPLVLALLAQRFLEPPDRSVMTGVILYALAAGWVIWASWRGEWLLATRQVEYRLGWQDTAFRPVSLLVAILLGVAAFIAFGGNQFTSINLFLWFLSLIFFLHAFWQFGVSGDSRWTEKFQLTWRSFLSEGLHLSPWTLLVIAAFALTVFFRFYMLDQVPGEMFSDHAEKLFDVSDVLEGEYRIFFPRNTGREAFQMYLTAAMALVFNTGFPL